MNPRIRLSRRARTRIFDRANGICHICGLPIDAAAGAAWEVEHKKPLWAGGKDEESNMAPAHRSPCHEQKNAEENTDRAKTDRQRANYLGIPKSRKQPLPGGRDSAITMTMNRGPQKRMSQTEKHRAFVARRQIGVTNEA